MSVAETVTGGSLLLAIPLALLAGFVSFASPCVLPLVPGYVGVVTGVTGAELEEQVTPRNSRILAGVGLFILGFSVVFISYGALLGFGGEVRHAGLDGGSGATDILKADLFSARSGDDHRAVDEQGAIFAHDDEIGHARERGGNAAALTQDERNLRHDARKSA